MGLKPSNMQTEGASLLWPASGILHDDKLNGRNWDSHETEYRQTKLLLTMISFTSF